MSPGDYTLLHAAHGTLAGLGLAVLLHPVITLRRRRGLAPWTVRTADLGALLLLLPSLLGLALYPSYRARVKPTLWATHPEVAWRFETKEHLAAVAVALALGGALTLRTAGRHPAGRRAAATLLLWGWILGVATGLLGIYVRTRAHPGW
ncbi:MAG TPA: hypothetical protein ENK18_07095 [Deltaproteobacteria bacterium]|nr:hypothetical protein [Deltaproteobacteria bacterium]